MTKIAELRHKRAKLVADLRGIYERALAESRDMSAEETAQESRMEADLKLLERSIELAEQEDRAAGITGQTPDAIPVPETGEQRRVADSPEYLRAFDRWLRGDVRALNEFRATTDPMTTSTGVGGDMVPVTFINQLIHWRDTLSNIRPIANVINLGSGQHTMPLVSTEGTAVWVAENSDFTVAQDTTDHIHFKALKLGRIVKVTYELAQDSAFDIMGYIANSLGRSIAKAEDIAYTTGAGTTEPVGITSCAAGVTAAGATSITSDELLDLVYSVRPEYWPNARFLMAPSTALILRKLKDGNQQYIWQAGLQTGQPDSLCGFPVNMARNMPAATTGLKAIVFGDVKAGYTIGDRQGVTIQRLNELYAVAGNIGFLGYCRCDAQITDSYALRHLVMG